ncbi:hypothetical protein HC028_17275 [Planosporangium flavigriseum]|uniref:Uncharacterized protein n=1 Tax=Planosporangium flavigriseum TaxID=373681 RepID=A0A8J3LNN4_9ACTN|nr:hypothetical protein [Planosporangium flavigriseum]NJC66242.1 hypothetical protein [Planosporangium flavigriseum]GIG74699.1 hypothetical protein Pfl04_31030 [Planosporangium flavigriseum]
MTKKNPVSPAASGGAGTLFEYRVAAIAYSYLLSGAHPPGLAVSIAGVGLQQRVRGHLLDDIVVTAEPSPNPLCTEYQVKLTLSVTAADWQFVSVITQALHVLDERADDVARGDLDLGLIARGDQDALDQLAALTNFARGHTAEETFADVFEPGVVNQPLRDRRDQVRKAVEAAIAEGAPDLGGVAVSAHALLSALHVWRVSDGDDGADYLAALDRLTPAAESFGVNPVDLFGHLASLAQGWGVVAGVVDATSIRRQLRRRGLGLRKTAGDGPVVDPHKVDADAVVRGPVAALELDGALDQAERLLAAGDPSAADLFADMANRLEEARFWPHAAIMRRREADARQSAGYSDDAVIGRVGLAWAHLDAVQPWEAGFALNDGRRPGVAERVSALAARVSKAVDAAVWVAKGSDLDGLVTAFDGLEEGDPYRERAAAFLCEEAIADARPDVMLDRRDLLEAVARTAAGHGDGPTRRCGARIQMCIADATGQWAPLLPEIHRRYPRPIVAWAHARYGRHLALSGDGAGAQTQYLLAIERACVAEMFDEAADWLYALRTVRFWYADFETDDQHPLAQALRPNAKPSQLPGSPHTAEHALRAMLDEGKPREALQRVQRWRWQAVVRAQLTEEIDAVESLGTLLQRHDEIQAAIKCFVRAGAEKEAAAAARYLPDAPAHLDTDMLAPVESCRTAAYAAVAAAADLISDDDARTWADAALAEIAADHDERLIGRSARLQAFDALAALCDSLSDDQVDKLLLLVAPLIDRPADHYRHTDEAVAKILMSAAAKRTDVVPLLVRALLADQRMAEIILAGATDVFKTHKDVVGKLLEPAAPAKQHACLALILAGVEPAPALEYARSRVDQELTAREHQPGRITYYAGAAQVAILASVLDSETRIRVARTMLDRALDRREATVSRRDSLKGLINIVADVDDSTRATLLPSVLEMARGEHDGGPADDILHGSSGFSMLKIADGSPTLSDLALECAARLAADQSDLVAVEQIGIALLRTADEPGQWRIGRALALLPARASELRLDHCAVHPSPALRALAALRWARDPAALPAATAVQLARDDDHRVRHVLARAVRDNHGLATNDETTNVVVNILASDARRSIRSYIAGLVTSLPGSATPT